MASEGRSRGSLTINIADEGRMMALRTVLGYEAVVRGLTIGQAFYAIIKEAADLDNYPPELKERLLECETEMRQQALARAMSSFARQTKSA